MASRGCRLFHLCVHLLPSPCCCPYRSHNVGRERGPEGFPPTGQTTQDLDKVKQAEELVEALTSPVIREREEQIRKGLKEKGLDDNSETVKVLVRYLATTLLLVTFEEFYRIIFGSQIFLLKTANENRAPGLHDKFVQDHFSQVRQLFVPTFDQWKVEDYVHFLLTSGLLLKDGDFYQITNLGVDFLEWITKIGAPEKKGF